MTDRNPGKVQTAGRGGPLDDQVPHKGAPRPHRQACHSDYRGPSREFPVVRSIGHTGSLIMRSQIRAVVTLLTLLCVALAFWHSPVAAAAAPAKKIVLIAGEKSHGPVGNGIHDYPWSVKLLKVMLDNSNVAECVRVEFHLDGWPEDEN